MPGVLFTLASQAAAQQPGSLPKLTPEMMDQAAAISGLTLTDEQKKLMMDGLNEQRGMAEIIRDLHLPNSTPPSFHFDPVPAGMSLDTAKKPALLGPAPTVAGLSVSNEASLAFATVRQLGELLRTRKATSLELTKLYLARLKRYDPMLHFVVTLTEERAFKQAAEADKEIAAGRYRGPLHGIPWGAKDLLNVKGYRTTWGAGGFEQQRFDTDATVVQRLDQAGAVLLAKMTMGALASGDVWFGGKTRNPWNPKQGSSGSSAGSASSVSAGCVGFAIGTETLGSISSPSTRCGVTGLRPSFGFVPRTGAMALSWTMDKIGPICRSVEDCALVLSAIYGQDGQDRSVQPAAFNWDAGFDWKKLRVGYFADAFAEPKFEAAKNGYEGATPEEKQKKEAAAKQSFARRAYDAKYDRAALGALKKMGVTLIPVTLPSLPWGPMTGPLEAEAATAFYELTRSGRDSLLTAQGPDDWPNIFRTYQLYPAVDYINAMRARTLGIEAMAKLFQVVDVIVTPSSGMQLRATNLTGHPAVIVPNGVRGDDAPLPAHTEEGARDNIGGPGTPVSITFLGQLYSDARLAAFARTYQEATGFHTLHPRLA